MQGNLNKLKKEINQLHNPARAKVSAWFFKTGKGQYGEGDRFLGLTSDQVKEVAKQFHFLSFSELSKLLKSAIHEERMAALRILTINFKKASENKKKQIFDFYLKHTDKIDSWDLVDASADKIVGGYLMDKPKGILTKLAKSGLIWERRIAMVATFEFIKARKVNETFKIAKLLLKDKHDLIHKAVGWMLREAGKRDIKAELAFLNQHATRLPRTALRYAIERFPEPLRKKYLLLKR